MNVLFIHTYSFVHVFDVYLSILGHEWVSTAQLPKLSAGLANLC